MNASEIDTRIYNLLGYKSSGKALTARERVLDLILFAGETLTRNEISDRLGMRLSSVCGRANELLEAGVIRVAEIRKDRMTGKRCEALAPIPVAHQIGMDLR